MLCREAASPHRTARRYSQLLGVASVQRSMMQPNRLSRQNGNRPLSRCMSRSRKRQQKTTERQRSSARLAATNYHRSNQLYDMPILQLEDHCRIHHAEPSASFETLWIRANLACTYEWVLVRFLALSLRIVHANRKGSVARTFQIGGCYLLRSSTNPPC